MINMLQNEDKHDKYNVANEKKIHTYHLVEDLKFDRKKEKCNFTQLSGSQPGFSSDFNTK